MSRRDGQAFRRRLLSSRREGAWSPERVEGDVDKGVSAVRHPTPTQRDKSKIVDPERAAREPRGAEEVRGGRRQGARLEMHCVASEWHLRVDHDLSDDLLPERVNFVRDDEQEGPSRNHARGVLGLLRGTRIVRQQERRRGGGRRRAEPGIAGSSTRQGSAAGHETRRAARHRHAATRAAAWHWGRTVSSRRRRAVSGVSE